LYDKDDNGSDDEDDDKDDNYDTYNDTDNEMMMIRTIVDDFKSVDN